MKFLKPWGYYQVLFTGPAYQVKQLHIDTGHKISLQSHQHRDEHWIVIDGEASIAINGRNEIMKPKEHILINKGDIHRISNSSEGPLIIIEIQFGKIIDEDDIIRLEDMYGRI
tara:strand:+ start:98 stop:436 length:339 start_codon:yes stop_codon:yes gene_type:complete